MIKTILKAILPKKVIVYLRNAKNNFLIKHKKFQIKAVTIEASSACSLKCELCSVPYIERPKKNMSLEDFKIIVNKLPKTVKLVRFNFAGEPLMNPDFFKMVAYLHQVLPGVHSLLSTNGELLDRFDVHEILTSNLSEFCLCLDGYNAETHETYRRNAHFDNVVRAAKKLVQAKKENGGKGPLLVQQTLLSKITCDHIPEINKLAKEIGMDRLDLRWMTIPGMYNSFEEIISASPGFKMKTPDYFDKMAEKYLPPQDMTIYKKSSDSKFHLNKELHYCTAYEMPFIMQNGDVAICCHDPEGQTVFANLLHDSFEEFYNKIPAKRIFNKQYSICTICELTECGKNKNEKYL